MAKRKFAGGNPFVSRKKYKGKLFALPRKDTWKDKATRVAAKVSGAALGGILGNVPGAYVGYQVGSWAGKRATRKKKLIIKKSQVRASSTHNDLTTHSLGSISMNKYPKKPDTKIAVSVINKSNFIMNGGLAAMGVNGTSQGAQAVDYLDEICHRDWFVTNLSDNRFNRRALATDLYKFTLDYAYTFTGYTGEIPRIFENERIYLDYIDVEYGFLSMTTVPQLVDVYLCSPKSDLGNNPLTQLATGTNVEGNGQRIAATAGNTTVIDVQDGSYSAATAKGYEDWGKNPFGVAQFRKNYLCKKKFSMTLNPGDQRHYKLRIYYKKYMDRVTYTNFRVLDHIKDLTITPLVVARAGLIGIKKAEDAEANEVAYGKAKVGITTNMKIKMNACYAPRIQPMERYHRGIQQGTSDVIQEIDDEDNVKPVEQN